MFHPRSQQQASVISKSKFKFESVLVVAEEIPNCVVDKHFFIPAHPSPDHNNAQLQLKAGTTVTIFQILSSQSAHY
jgi:hypothetical protein